MNPGWMLKSSLIALLLPLPLLAGTPFAGTWTVQPPLTEFSGKSLGLSIETGVYKRTSCSVADEVAADGADHALNGDPYFDTMSVRVPDKRTAEVVQKTAGKVTWQGRYSVERDLRAMTLKYEDRRATKAVTGEIRFEREDSVAPHSHALTGTWRPVKVLELSPSALTLEFQDTEGGLMLHAGDGRSFNIKFSPSSNEPLQGYLPGAMVHLGRRAPNTLQMNRTQNGTLVDFTLGTVADDGQTMIFGQMDWQCQLKTDWLLRKQPAS
jgi:hypothetical protein